MIKNFLAAITMLTVIGMPVATACPLAEDITSANFCNSFRYVAQCHCMAHGLPSRLCNDMSGVYQRMLIVYGSLEQACLHQTDTSPQNCINSWNCFRHGGTSSDNQLCSGTGAACA